MASTRNNLDDFISLSKYGRKLIGFFLIKWSVCDVGGIQRVEKKVRKKRRSFLGEKIQKKWANDFILSIPFFTREFSAN